VIRGASDCAQVDLATAQQIAEIFLPGEPSLSLRRLGGGLSGAAVFACQTEQRCYALKRWPAGTSAARVDEVHEVMMESRRTLPLVPELVRCPLESTRLGWESYYYELATWMIGQPLADGIAPAPADMQPILSAVQAGAEAIAGFHDSVRRWGSACAPAPAVLRRLGRIEQLRAELPQAIQRAEGLSPTLLAAANWLRRDGLGRLEAAAAMLGRWASTMVPNQIVLRDVHREHVLFAHGRVSGLIDFDAIGRDTVATDLARWVSGFLSPELDPEPMWSAAEAGYQRMRTISSAELELARAISGGSGVISLANWVVWVALKQRDFSGCYDLVDRRVGELLRRMGTDRIVSDARC
jgi:Ser/Thr protein kinase RdoA (MazF antagonist)